MTLLAPTVTLELAQENIRGLEPRAQTSVALGPRFRGDDDEGKAPALPELDLQDLVGLAAAGRVHFHAVAHGFADQRAGNG